MWVLLPTELIQLQPENHPENCCQNRQCPWQFNDNQRRHPENHGQKFQWLQSSFDQGQPESHPENYDQNKDLSHKNPKIDMTDMSQKSSNTDNFDEVIKDKTKMSEISQSKIQQQPPPNCILEFTPVMFYGNEKPVKQIIKNQGKIQDENEKKEETDQSYHDDTNPTAQELQKETSKSIPKRKRINKSEKTEEQKKSKGYWLKNFLPWGKIPHFKFIKKYNPQLFQKNNNSSQADRINKIINKNGINFADYLYLYSIPELKEIWEEFFRQGKLQKDLEKSTKVKPQNKAVYIKFLFRYEDAFKTGIFDRIA